jgi:hypothetical protein
MFQDTDESMIRLRDKEPKDLLECTKAVLVCLYLAIMA